MNFTISDELKTQMAADGVDFIHIRDAISVDIEKDGSYTTDFDGEKKIELRDDYINKMSRGLEGWFNSLKSDGSWYTNLEGNCLNIHGEQVEDSA